jgi:uncharacterized protein YndB with AHSA1/START domain
MTHSAMPEPTGAPDPERREIRLEIEVPGTIEEVWDAIATGPGITSWYVPHTLEEREGGAATASFGPGPEMQVPGRIAVWEPPHRIVFTGDTGDTEDTGDAGLAFEWLVEARDQGTCVVRLVNTGFGDGNPWDDQYDDMLGGWKLFLRNLWAHRMHFAGRHATPALPMGVWPGASEEVWPKVLVALGLPAAPQPGDRVATAGEGVPDLAGTVLDARPGSLALLLDQPAPGTGIIAAERHGEVCGVSLWVYLYGPDAAALATAHEASASAWLARQAG